jgi:sugar phosphate isomerase/epimerase
VGYTPSGCGCEAAASAREVNVLLGKGICRIPEMLQELHRHNSSGLVGVEYEKEGSVEDELRQEAEFARKLALSRPR